MYKGASKFAQRLRERDARRAKRRNQDEGRASRKPSDIRCPWCGVMLQRNTLAIRQHALKAHRRLLSEPEAFRMASPPRARKDAPGPERLRKNFHEVPSGLPSLGKRR